LMVRLRSEITSLPSKLLRIRSSCTSGERERGCVFNFCAVPYRRSVAPKRGLCVTTLVTRNEGGHSTANHCNRQSLSLIHKLHLLSHLSINGKNSRLRDKSDLTQYLRFDAY
jgi:hypothetical protein